MGNHPYGRPPGNIQDKRDHGMLDIPGGITLTQIAAGALDLADMGAGDSQDTLTVDGTTILSAAITFTTDLATTARLVAQNINAGTVTHGYWARIKPAATDWIQIFKTGTPAADTTTVTGTDTGFTPVYVNMGTEIAYAAAVRMPSWNYGVDMFASTNVFRVAFDMTLLPIAGNAGIQSFKPVELIIYPEDQVIYGHVGPEGVIYCPSAVETVIDILGAFDGDIDFYLSAAAATNCAYRQRGY